jgi:hypothetical protein
VSAASWTLAKSAAGEADGSDADEPCGWYADHELTGHLDGRTADIAASSAAMALVLTFRTMVFASLFAWMRNVIWSLRSAAPHR